MANEIEAHIAAKTEKQIQGEIGILGARLNTIQVLLAELREHLEKLRKGPDIRVGLISGHLPAATIISELKEGYIMAVLDVLSALDGNFRLEDRMKPLVLDSPYSTRFKQEPHGKEC